MKNILHIIPENTSSLDFTLPIFWENSKNKKYNFNFIIIVFYLNKSSVLKNSSFFIKTTKKLNISIYDLSDFLSVNNYFKSKIKSLYNFSNTDKINLSDPKKYFINTSKNKISFIINFSKYLFRNHGIKDIFRTFLYMFLDYLSNIIIYFCFSFENIYNNLNASGILFDNRGRKNFLGSNSFFNTVRKLKIPTILVPHGAHYRTPTGEYCPFLPDQYKLPKYCHHWSPFKYGTPWEVSNTQKVQFSYVGYPGMDRKWISFLKKNKSNKSNRKGSMRILYIVRRYVDKKNPIFSDTDYYIIDKDDFFSPLEDLIGFLRKQKINAEIIIKPHPKNSIKELKRDIRSLAYSNISITQEPIYDVLSRVDIALSLHSTILFIPILFNIPTILVNDELHEKVIKRWPVLKDLYNNLSFFSNNRSKLVELFTEVFEIVDNPNREKIKDIEHIYSFFSKDSSLIALKDLRTIMNNK